MPRTLGRVLAVAVVSALSACSGDTNPVRDMVVATGLATEPKQAPDFIKASRQAEMDYKPVGLAGSQPRAKKRSPDEVKKLEAELDALRTGNEAKGAAARQAGAAATPAAPAPAR